MQKDYQIKDGKLSGVDGIRGMAFLFVFIIHTLSLKGDWGIYLVGSGKIGVWLFFILSSFLLSYYFINKPQRTKSLLEWANYLFRRFIRIFPLYAVVLCIYYYFKIVITDTTLIKESLLLHVGLAHFWTLPVENKYYIVLPIVVLFIVFVARNSVLISILLYIALFTLNQHFYPVSKSVESSTSLMQYLSVFVWGSITALLHCKLRNFKIPNKLRVLFDIMAIFILVLTILSIPGIRFEVFGIAPSRYLMTKYIIFGFSWSFFILCVLNGYGSVKKIFELPILRFLGNISYPAYLIHWLFLSFCGMYIKTFNLKSLLVMVLCTITSAYILHVLVEKPLSRLNLIALRNKILNSKTDTVKSTTN